MRLSGWISVSVLLSVLCFAAAGSLPAAAASGAQAGTEALTLRRLSAALGDLISAQTQLSQGYSTARTPLSRASLHLAAAALELAATHPEAARLIESTASDLEHSGTVSDTELTAKIIGRSADELRTTLQHFQRGELTPQEGQRITVNPPSVDFGTVCINDPRDFQLTITNKTAVARSLRFRSFGSFPATLATSLPATLGPGESVDVTLRFLTDTVDRYRGSVFVEATAEGERDAGVFIRLEGETTLVEATPDPLEFGEVTLGNQRVLPVTIRNCSTVQLVVTVVAPYSEDYELPNAEGTEITLAPRSSGQVNVTFKPTEVGELPSWLNVTLRRRVGRRIRRQRVGQVLLRGVGKEAVKVGARLIDFGTVAQDEFHTRTLALTNNTDVAQPVSIVGTKLDPEYFTLSPAGDVTLPANATTQVSIRFGAIGRCVHRGRIEIRGPGIPKSKARVNVKVRTR